MSTHVPLFWHAVLVDGHDVASTEQVNEEVEYCSGQAHWKPPPDVDVHVPPFSQGLLAHPSSTVSRIKTNFIFFRSLDSRYPVGSTCRCSPTGSCKSTLNPTWSLRRFPR